MSAPRYQMPATDRHRFEVVYRGAWYLLGSLSDHIRAGVNPAGTVYLLYSQTLGRETRALKSEVHIPCKPIAWERV